MLSDLVYYDIMEQQICTLQRLGRQLLADADMLENAMLKNLGIECVNREPGFPCWIMKGKTGYFNTPREAMEAR